jgi:hypothetical protein
MYKFNDPTFDDAIELINHTGIDYAVLNGMDDIIALFLTREQAEIYMKTVDDSQGFKIKRLIH